jgi:YggT family protein
MVYLGNIIYGLAWILNSVLTIYFFIVIGSAILSWVNPDPYNPIVRFLRGVTEPAYIYVRRYIPFVYLGGFDLSPIILLLAIQFCKFAVVRNLEHFARQIMSGPL